jgi:hypothetical protein
MVAVGQGTNTLAYSFNGISWIGLGTSVFTSFGYSVAWNGSLWVAVGSGSGGATIATSPNGINWTARSSQWTPGTLAAKAVAWNGSLWVAGGQGTTVPNLATSPDGITWTSRSSGLGTTGAVAVAWNGWMWVAVGGTGSISDTIVYSYDGINWIGAGSPFDNFDGGGGVAWNGSLWVAVGGGSSHTIATSPDGINWTGRGRTIFTGRGEGVAWNGSLWVVTGQGGVTLGTSSNGINWVVAPSPPTFSYSGYGVAWNGSVWVATGREGTTLSYSSNAANWATVSGIFSYAGYGLAARRVLPYAGTSLISGNSSAPVRATFGIRFPYSNVSSGTSLTVSRNTYGTVYNITTAALTNLTLDFNGAVWSADSNAYWTLRNNTQTYLSLVTASANTSTLGVTVVVPTPITIPPTNSTIVMLDNLSNIVLF